jgi:sugar phosphate isomerase/epimerase
MEPKLRIAAITDEFSPDPEIALDAMAGIGMRGAELRVLWEKNILDLSNDELRRLRGMLAVRGMETVSIASPLLKCVLPDAPAVDERLQKDVFASKHTYGDQPRLAERAFEVASLMGAKMIRVFSYWRTVEPESCFSRIAEELGSLAAKAGERGFIIGLENEHACNIATAAESARMLAAVEHPSLKLVWDPANALCAGEVPFPDGYLSLPTARIAHVHAKDCHIEAGRPVWGPLGTRAVDWRGQIGALIADGYSGWLSLETHWPGPANDKLRGSIICGWNLRGLAAG